MVAAKSRFDTSVVKMLLWIDDRRLRWPLVEFQSSLTRR